MPRPKPKTKTCSQCRRRKKLAEFKPDKRYRFGVHGACKNCDNEYRRKDHALHPEYQRTQDRRYNLKRLYNMTVEEYEEMLRKQKGGCWICGYVPKPGGRRLAVDHDHRSKKPRGLLCHMCNRGIAHFRDKPDRLRKAADYLSK